MTETIESIDRALAELEEAREAYYEISDRRSIAKTLAEQYQLQKNVVKTLKRLNEAEKSWAKSMELYCRLVGF